MCTNDNMKCQLRLISSPDSWNVNTHRKETLLTLSLLLQSLSAAVSCANQLDVE